MDPPCLVDYVKELALNHTLPSVEDVYKKKFNIENEENLETMLEKLAILTHIYDREF